MSAESVLTIKKYFTIVITFTIINTLSIFLIFNTDFFYTTDNSMLSLKFVLITIVILFIPFLLTFKYSKSLTITKLFLIFILTRFVFFAYFTFIKHGLDLELEGLWRDIADNILNEGLFTPYSSDIVRITPPLLIWWYVYNYYVHQFNPAIWRFVTVLLEIGIFYVLIKIYEEIKPAENKRFEDNFKRGLSFYIFSIFPIIFFILYGYSAAFPIVLGLLGLLYYFRSKNEPKNIYYSVFFFTLCALTQYYTTIFLMGVFLLLLFQKNFKKFLVLLGEAICIFCVVSLPFLINDAEGFVRRMFLSYTITPDNWTTTVWAFEPEILRFLPAIYALCVIIIYFYKNQNQTTTLGFFIVIISIIFVFLPIFHPWYCLWVLLLLSISIINSFRKYITVNLLFLAGLYFYYLFLAICFLLFRRELDPDYYVAFTQIIEFGETAGFSQAFQLFGLLHFQIGLFYLIYSVTKSKHLLGAVVLPFSIFYSIQFLISLGLFIYFW